MDRQSWSRTIAMRRAIILLLLTSLLLTAQEAQFMEEFVPWLWKTVGAAIITYAVTRTGGAIDFSDTAEGQYNKGVRCLNGGDGVMRDPVAARDWFLKAANRDYSKAQFALAELEYRGDRGVERDETDATKWYRAAASHDDARAQYMMGYLYTKGGPVRASPPMAAEFFERAATHGHREAQRRLGYIYETGYGVARVDYQQAAYWYRQASDQGDTSAGVYLASLMFSGQAASPRGVSFNDYDAVALLTNGAHAGLATADSGLGWAYENGRGVMRDDFQARTWYQQAAMGGDAFGQYGLARFCDYGRGGPPDVQCAIDWYQRALNNNADPLDPQARQDAGQRLKSNITARSMWNSIQQR